MKEDNHISEDQLKDYACHFINDQSVVDGIKAHLEKCKLCQNNLVSIGDMSNLLDSWTAGSHGEAMKKSDNPEKTNEKIKKALEKLH